MKRAAVFAALVACASAAPAVHTIPAPARPLAPAPVAIDWANREYELEYGLWYLHGTLRGGRSSMRFGNHDGSSGPLTMRLTSATEREVSGRRVTIVHLVEDAPEPRKWWAFYSIEDGAPRLLGAIFSATDELRFEEGRVVLAQGRCTREVTVDAAVHVAFEQTCPPPPPCEKECPESPAPGEIRVCSHGGVFVGDRETTDERAFDAALAGRRTGLTLSIDYEAKLRAPERIADVARWLRRAHAGSVPANVRLGVGCGCCDEMR